MTLAAGSRIGPYEIVAPLGAGGMGEVYRARDSRLDRQVAIKILPEAFAQDTERLTRFEREAKTLASLNHPNIAQIYGIEANALVMELVEGEDLSARIARGPIPIDEALSIARQIADALSAAHEQGVVHRDLKPANIKVREDGTVKVLDFGLAKAVDPSSTPGASAMNSPTITSPATQAGVILGTAAYMSPEQARGRGADRRADVWAFGVVLLEMLTGRRVFAGDEISDVLASVLKDTPAIESVPSGTPAAVRRLLRRCLEKERAKRLDSMAAARMEIDDAIAMPLEAAHAVAMIRAISTRRAVAISLLAAAITGLTGGAAVWRFTRPEPPVVSRFSITPHRDAPLSVETNHQDVVIAPDGRRIVYFSASTAGNRFVIRSFDRFDVQSLGDSESLSRGPIMSPDGEWLAFQTGEALGTDSRLMKMPMAGGVPTLLARVSGNMRGGSWGDAGTIVYATTELATGLLGVSAAGGEPQVLTAPNSLDGETDHLWPHVLPGGKHVLFSIARTGGPGDIGLLSLETKTWRVLIKDAAGARYARTGHVLFAHDAALHAIPFDLKTLETSGTPIRIVDGVVAKESGAVDYDISAEGTLVYLPGAGGVSGYELAWLNPATHAVTAVGADAKAYRTGRISPDGRQAALGVEVAGDLSIWVLDFSRNTLSRLTPPSIQAANPVWSPDGQWIAFSGSPTGRAPGAPGRGVFRVRSTGTSAPERLSDAPPGTRDVPGTWTRDGAAILFTRGGGGAMDIHRITLTPAVKVEPLIAGPSLEQAPEVSPNGRWLAYVSDESGRRETYVRPYPNVHDRRMPVSRDGASVFAWSPDGREIIHLARSTMTRVPVIETRDGISFGAPTPERRLPNHVIAGWFAFGAGRGDVLMSMRKVDSTVEDEYRVVLNWFEELKARVRAGSK